MPKTGDIYEVLDNHWLSFTGGSDTRRPSGTHSITPKVGDHIIYLECAPDGTTWWWINGERVKFEANGWAPILRNQLRLVNNPIPKKCPACHQDRVKAMYSKDSFTPPFISYLNLYCNDNKCPFRFRVPLPPKGLPLSVPKLEYG